MSIYKRSEINPEWEPIPWNAHGPQVDEQERGFHARALKPLVWRKVDWKNFPENGIFGQCTIEDRTGATIPWGVSER